MEQPTTVAALIAAISSSRGELERAIGGLSDEQMVAPVLEGGWSAKDAIAHVTFWERRMLYALRPMSEGGSHRMRVPPEIEDLSDSQSWTDEVNARIFARNRERSLDEVRTDFERSYQELRERIDSLAPEDIFPAGTLQPDDQAALDVIAGNTYDHYPEHIEAIRRAFPSA